MIIQSYGISITTLEEVFLKVGHLTDPTKIFNEIEDAEDDPSNPARQASHAFLGPDVDQNFDEKLANLLSFQERQEKGKATGKDDAVASGLLNDGGNINDSDTLENIEMNVDKGASLARIEMTKTVSRDSIGVKMNQSIVNKIGDDSDMESVAITEQDAIVPLGRPS